LTGPFKLLELAVHRGPQPKVSEESTPETVLDALEWSEEDSAKELVERAEAVEPSDER
jgi:hypothetical protein